MHFLTYNSPFGKAMNRVFDLFILLILTILCSVPIITIGASFSALYYVLLKIVRNDEGNVVSQFFKGFKMNFLKGTGLWLIVGTFIAIFYVDFMLLRQVSMNFGDIENILLLILGAVLSMVIFYVFPMQAQFENSVFGTLKNSFLMCVMNFPKSLLLFGLRAVVFFIVLLIPETVYFLPAIAIVLCPYFSTQILVNVFEKYMPEVSGEGNPTSGLHQTAPDGAAIGSQFGQLSEDELPEEMVSVSVPFDDEEALAEERNAEE